MATMANSRPPGILGALLTERIPSRTPGVLGYLDQGDPSRTTLLGDTPGPIGWRDHGDASLAVLKAKKHGLQAVARDDEGRALAMAHAVPTVLPKPAAERLTLTQAQEIALQVTTYYEGGKAMHYQAVAGDFDGQGISFGLIQWNFGQDTLGPLLKKMLLQDPRAFQACFAPEADYETLKKALDLNSPTAQLKWARAQQAQNKNWKATFTALGGVDAFNRIQREEACARYHPLAMASIDKLRSLDADVMDAVELRTYVALFDLCVQQGSVSRAMESIRARVAKEKPQTQLELVKIAVLERGKAASQKWAADCISRRMGILEGSPYEALHNEVTCKRANPQLALLSEHANAQVAGL